MAISGATSRAFYPFWTYQISFQFPVNYSLLSQQICAVVYGTGKFNNKPSLAEAEMYQGSGSLQYRSRFLLASGGTSPPAQNSTWTRLPASCWDWKPFNQSPLSKMSLIFALLVFYVYSTTVEKIQQESWTSLSIPFPVWFSLPPSTKTSETSHSYGSYLHYFLLAWTFNKQTVQLLKIISSSDTTCSSISKRFHLFPLFSYHSM